ncbi:hypothetical protein BGW36DRAFT_437165 [Talaromyces proteolyticus]|uniref:2-deoxy-D-gluconate 3-dehydrogenase n=1 Tax=Talaromyces proteolyticus TaxID=1131652 RepID=A0AAD4PVE8_9EURO|nr:uncharacterized protein BGW36DRAFT_437165 [Talaromyces proteolyticus]KAH8693239.1 hypothetical protein BGW36DRAFT_437165 [Talaromyces proteolyticus]
MMSTGLLYLFNIKGKSALTTGGGRGIGRSMTIGLAEAGADIVLLLRNVSQTETQNQIENLGRKCFIYAADLEIKDEASKVIPEIFSRHKTDILVNAAGIQRRFAAVDYSQETYDEVMQVNMGSTFRLCRELGKHWIANNIKGVIINTASLASFQGGALSNEWAIHGIHTRSDPNNDYYKSIMDLIPSGKWGEPDDFKGTVAFLASKASSYITGQIITVDGGWMAR